MNTIKILAVLKRTLLILAAAAAAQVLSSCAQSMSKTDAEERGINLDAIEYTAGLKVSDLEKQLHRTPVKTEEKDGFAILSYKYLLLMPGKSAYSAPNGRFEFPAAVTVLKVYADRNGTVAGHEYEGYLYRHIFKPRLGTVDIQPVRRLYGSEIVKKFPK